MPGELLLLRQQSALFLSILGQASHHCHAKLSSYTTTNFLDELTVPDITVTNSNNSRPTSGDLWCIGVIIVAWYWLIQRLTTAHPVAHMLLTSHCTHAYTNITQLSIFFCLLSKCVVSYFRHTASQQKQNQISTTAHDAVTRWLTERAQFTGSLST